jgi:hypothetical protein
MKSLDELFNIKFWYELFKERSFLKKNYFYTTNSLKYI